MDGSNRDGEISKVRVGPMLHLLMMREAKLRGTSLNSVIKERLASAYAAKDYSPEIAALSELIARVMQATGEAITGRNEWKSFGETFWLTDAFAFDQACQAAIRILELARHPAPPTPYGFWLEKEPEIAVKAGRLMADGILEQLRGRVTTGAVHWVNRTRDALGVIAVRLLGREAPTERLLPLYEAPYTEPQP